MKNLRFLVTLFFAAFTGFANLMAQDIPVYTAGTDGFKSFRIPAITKLPNGNLLAFCEGRVNGSGDFGNVKIVLKRSTDNGKT